MAATLYLRYRPQDFDSVVGQEMTRITLKNASKTSKLAHAYLFTGPRGTGKTSMARIVAKAINCLHLKEDGNPDNQCEICQAINESRCVDIIEIDAASHTGVDDIREIIDKARFMPNQAKKKVYIIDEVHMLSKSAFNALLKTLEEPPEHVHFILATTESHKVPETIISRCQQFDFKRIEVKDIVYRLKYIAEKEGITAETNALNMIAKVSEGGLRNAITLFEKVAADKNISYEGTLAMLDITGIHIVESFYDDLQKRKTTSALTKIQDLYESGTNMYQFCKDILLLLREKWIEAIAENRMEDMKKLLFMIEIFDQTILELKNAVIPQLPLEVAVVKIHTHGTDYEISDSPKEEMQKLPSENFIPEKEVKIAVETFVRAENNNALPQTDTQTGVLEFSLAGVKGVWEQICQKMPASFKQVYKNGTVTQVKDNTITLTFSSNTFFEMANQKQAKEACDTICSELFHRPVILEILLAKSENEGMTAEDVADLFGGEIIS